jgi:protein farnesyltransferase/geranylgeranyltransferase type-1 subunit alpha
MDYFRAIVKNEEYSERAFELVSEALLLSPANYSIWCVFV